MAEEKKTSILQALGGGVVILVAILFFFGGGVERQAEKNLADIHQQVADDVVKQYDIAKRNGAAVDICVQAGMVSAAYLQAKDEPNYKKWKGIEAADCKRAGIK